MCPDCRHAEEGQACQCGAYPKGKAKVVKKQLWRPPPTQTTVFTEEHKELPGFRAAHIADIYKAGGGWHWPEGTPE